MNIFKNEYIKIILGIILGFSIASIFRCACNGRNCIIYKAPEKNDVKNSIYAHDKKCYKYETVSTECNNSAII